MKRNLNNSWSGLHVKDGTSLRHMVERVAHSAKLRIKILKPSIAPECHAEGAANTAVRALSAVHSEEKASTKAVVLYKLKEKC